MESVAPLQLSTTRPNIKQKGIRDPQTSRGRLSHVLPALFVPKHSSPVTSLSYKPCDATKEIDRPGCAGIMGNMISAEGPNHQDRPIISARNPSPSAASRPASERSVFLL